MTYQTLQPDDHAIVVGNGIVKPHLRRLARLGVRSYELGMCEHGPAAKCRAQIGRAEKTFSASHCEQPAPLSPQAFAAAIEGLCEAIEADRRGKAKRVGPVGEG